MIKKTIVLSTLTLALLASRVSADSTCTTQYGGTTTCVPTDLTINKQVVDPGKDAVVENLTTTDTKFTPGSEVTYKLTIKNASGETFNPVKVKDTLPPYLSYVSISGDTKNINYDAGLRILTFELENVTAGESRTFDLKAKVTDVANFPEGKSLFCVVNLAEVSASNRTDSDSAQICLENGETAKVSKLPVAGFNDLMILLPFMGVGLGGFALLKGKRS